MKIKSNKSLPLRHGCLKNIFLTELTPQEMLNTCGGSLRSKIANLTLLAIGMVICFYDPHANDSAKEEFSFKEGVYVPQLENQRKALEKEISYWTYKPKGSDSPCLPLNFNVIQTELKNTAQDAIENSKDQQKKAIMDAIHKANGTTLNYLEKTFENLEKLPHDPGTINLQLANSFNEHAHTTSPSQADSNFESRIHDAFGGVFRQTLDTKELKTLVDDMEEITLKGRESPHSFLANKKSEKNAGAANVPVTIEEAFEQALDTILFKKAANQTFYEVMNSKYDITLNVKKNPTT